MKIFHFSTNHIDGVAFASSVSKLKNLVKTHLTNEEILKVSYLGEAIEKRTQIILSMDRELDGC